MSRIAPIALAFAVLSSAFVAVAAHSAARSSPPCTPGGVYDVAVPGAPMSAVATLDERTVFVSLNSTNPSQPNGIAVLSCSGGRYRLQRVIHMENQPTIMALTHDGKMLVVPDDSFIAFVDVAKARSNAAEPIVGYIEDVPGDDGGAIYAAVSADDRHAFIAEEQTGNLTVVDLQKLRAAPHARTAIVSEFVIGNAPVALVPSKDGAYLFATVQGALKRYNYDKVCMPEGAVAADAPKESPGSVVTIDIAKAVSDPAHAIVSDIRAGCHPVRAALSPDGATLWVTARASKALLAFSTQKLIAADATAKRLETPLGAAPVPVIVTPDGKWVLAGNSNRFGQGGTGVQDVVVTDAVTGTVRRHFPVGKFPRQFTRTASGSLIFLCVYGSNKVTVIDPSTI